MKILPKLIRAVVYLLLLAPIVLVATCIVVMPNCGESSDAVSYARSLSKERLHELFYDMEDYSKRDTTPLYGYDMLNEQFPNEFLDLEVAKIRPREGNIMVEGCFDHYVYLDFGGIGKFQSTNVRRIQVSWGQGSSTGTQVLWSE